MLIWVRHDGNCNEERLNPPALGRLETGLSAAHTRSGEPHLLMAPFSHEQSRAILGRGMVRKLSREIDMGFNQSVNRFRARRGRLLRQQIVDLSAYLGRDIIVLDLGGRMDYWDNVGLDNISRIELLNTSLEEFGPDTGNDGSGIFREVVGDACCLPQYKDKSFDLVHSNSVIEHVGDWKRMRAMAVESQRVGVSGWIQTPAWEFPVEPHFHLPFMHWFETPVRSKMISWSPLDAYRELDLDTRRSLAESINLVSKREFRALFPDSMMHVERLIFAKSYTARWMPLQSLAA